MSFPQIRTIEDAGRATTVAIEDIYDQSPHVGQVAMALVPASLILAAATALLVALL